MLHIQTHTFSPVPSTRTHTISDIGTRPVASRCKCTWCWHGESEVTARVSRRIWVGARHGTVWQWSAGSASGPERWTGTYSVFTYIHSSDREAYRFIWGGGMPCQTTHTRAPLCLVFLVVASSRFLHPGERHRWITCTLAWKENTAIASILLLDQSVRISRIVENGMIKHDVLYDH